MRVGKSQLLRHGQRLPSDRPCGAQQGYGFRHRYILDALSQYSVTAFTIIQITGAAKITLSNRSSTPPCPGSSRP